MDVPKTVLDACHRLAAEVSGETLQLISSALIRGEDVIAGERLASDARWHVSELMRAWRADGPHIAAREVGYALSGSAHAVQRERVLRQVELVWSGPTAVDSTFRSTGPALLELITGAKQTVYLVTFAAYRVPAVAAALEGALRRGVRVVFVLESDESGKVSFDPLPYLTSGAEFAPEVYCWPVEKRRTDERGRHGTLHAKFAVADRLRLLVSSANLTEFAFDLNIELGVLLSGGAAPVSAVDHIESLIRSQVLRRVSSRR